MRRGVGGCGAVTRTKKVWIFPEKDHGKIVTELLAFNNKQRHKAVVKKISVKVRFIHIEHLSLNI